jgi:ABC-2 type transport system ATP-binding protein
MPAKRIGEVLEQVELTPRARSKFSTYSMGMKQRLGVAAALLKDPELLVLDEPTNGLDPQGMVDMRNLIVELGKGSRTVLVSSHLLSEVEQMCTRVGVIRKGSLVAEGSIAELRGETGLYVRAYPVEKALAVLEDAVGAGHVARDGDAGFTVRAEPGKAPEINWKLVNAGVGVLELRPRERSLEDVFLELTGGEAGL